MGHLSEKQNMDLKMETVFKNLKWQCVLQNSVFLQEIIFVFLSFFLTFALHMGQCFFQFKN